MLAAVSPVVSTRRPPDGSRTPPWSAHPSSSQASRPRAASPAICTPPAFARSSSGRQDVPALAVDRVARGQVARRGPRRGRRAGPRVERDRRRRRAGPRRRSRRRRGRSCGPAARRRPAAAGRPSGRSAGRGTSAPRPSVATARLTSWPIRSVSSNGPSGKPPASRSTASIVAGSATPLLEQPLGLAVERPGHPVDDEARRSRRTAPGSCPRTRTRSVASSTYAGSLASPRTTSTSFIRYAGLKKCRPTSRSGRGQRACERGHRQRRGVGGEQRVGADDLPPGSREQGPLGREVLGDRLDDELAAGQVGDGPRPRMTRALAASACSAVIRVALRPAGGCRPARCATACAALRRAGRRPAGPGARPTAATWAMPAPMVPAPTIPTGSPCWRSVRRLADSPNQPLMSALMSQLRRQERRWAVITGSGRR